ncbi:helix-turn-helix domain-containing protein [Megamonas funiformis]|uniref:HTH cro/C1-type domain-containing protein n=1 Tax=Megamonas funiformis YIT 11815 TaxID=742816 RepID=A0ABP2NM71_9FIRM|nr:XRE family transcriptional regulator [Megamonas funiformis]EHR38814.1 hypothetical protein HMPREF9454_00412 [Megamonas funiformis YIT 11815]QIB60249.1 helix-turn-helix domain-containing protein [Megamonas funiformis]
MPTIGENIKKARKQANLTQMELAKITNLSRSYIGDIEKDRYNPSLSTLKAIAKATNQPLNFFISNQSNTPAKGIKIPVLGRVVAGIPVEAITDIIDYEEITEELARTGDFFALQVKGESMAPRIRENDVVIVRKQSTVENKEVAIVLVNGNEATIKEVQFQENGITLIGWNPAVYTPHFYSAKDIETLPVQIIGKVIELRGKF